MKKWLAVLTLLTCFTGLLTAQEKQKLTLDDVLTKGAFAARSLPGFQFLNDGRSYLIRQGNELRRMDIVTGNQLSVLLPAETFSKLAGEGAILQSYSLSRDASVLLLQTDSEPIYRHSDRAKVYAYNTVTNTYRLMQNGNKVSNALLSPDSRYVAYVYENDLYYTDLHTGAETRVTDDGRWNYIINGMADWVYEEEFSFTRAFEWSPDSRSIGFLRFDESAVPEFTMDFFRDELYPEKYSFKYPKVGERNATVSVHFYNLDNKERINVQLAPDSEVYIPRIKWTNDPSSLCITRLNRHQNNLDLLLANRNNGSYTHLLNEKNERYIDIHDDLTFLGKDEFIWISEMEGYNQVYLYDMQGKLINKVTTAAADVARVYGIDPKSRQLYYQLIAPTPKDRQVRTVQLNGKKDQLLSAPAGSSAYQFTSDFSYAVSNHSDANTPPVIRVVDKKNKAVRILEDNAAAITQMKKFNDFPVSFFDFTTTEGVTLNGWMIKPPDFDPTKKYPLFMTLYGGPGSQQVVDQWSGRAWFKYLAEQGYVIACVDNRGTGGRGEAFKKMTYLQLGHYETIDQIEAARHLGSLPYVDAARIGIFGWSYGGYMSTLCLLKGADVFKSALAVAPVTNWKWYDSIYTERFMRTEAENPQGYKDNSPVYFADQLKGNYFLAHGMADDNVHFQNSAEMNRQLIRAGKQFEFHMYPNSNHGIYSEGATLHLYHAMTKFILEKI